jgi:hypothetical protein
MSVHAVSFQLNQKDKFYTDFFEKIQSFGGHFEVHKTLWLVSLPDDRENDSVYNFLQKYIHNDDYLVVIKINGDSLKTIQGWVKPDVWAWLRAQAQ